MLATPALAAAWHHCRWNLFGGDDLGLFARGAAGAGLHRSRGLADAAAHPPDRSSIPCGRHEWTTKSASKSNCGRFATATSGRPPPAARRVAVEGPLPDLAAGDRFQAFAHLLPPEHAMNPGEADRADRDRGRRITAIFA